MSTSLANVVEVLLLASGRALKVEELLELLKESSLEADRASVREALTELQEDWASRGLELREVASGFRLQVRADYAPWLSRLWAEKPARYSRALLETLALIAYRQPITRGEIEDVRGVSVSANIIKTLLEREWVRVLGHREVPGRPAIYGTTRTFLDDFNLTGLEDLPPLAEVKDIDRFHDDLFAEGGRLGPAAAGGGDGQSRPDGDASDETAPARNEAGETSPETAQSSDSDTSKAGTGEHAPQDGQSPAASASGVDASPADAPSATAGDASQPAAADTAVDVSDASSDAPATDAAEHAADEHAGPGAPDAADDAPGLRRD